MQKTLIVCDRCGKEITDNTESLISIAVTITQKRERRFLIGRKDDYDSSNNPEEIDLCSKCTDYLTQRIEKLKAEALKHKTNFSH